MGSSGRWWARLTAALGAVLVSLFMPVTAWASSDAGSMVVEAARRRGGGFGIFSTLCCLAVVGVIVVVVLLIMRNRKSKGPR